MLVSVKKIIFKFVFAIPIAFADFFILESIINNLKRFNFYEAIFKNRMELREFTASPVDALRAVYGFAS
jgi:hypothetical protein